MSDLKPIGEPLTLDGVERHLLFTLNVVEAVQDHFSCSLEEVINKLTDKKESAGALKHVLMELLNDEAERAKHAGDGPELKKYTEREIGWLITQDNILNVTVGVLRAYGLSLPVPDEFESPNAEGRQSE